MIDDDEGAADPRLARQRAYALLGALLVEGLDAEGLSRVRALPGLGDALPPESTSEAAELDALAAEHQALFGHEVFPFSGVFMGPSGLVGEGAAAGAVAAGERGAVQDSCAAMQKSSNPGRSASA